MDAVAGGLRSGHGVAHRPLNSGALLLEGGEALAEVLAAGGQLEREGLVAELLAEAGVLAGVQQPLGQAEGDGGPGGQPLDQGRGLVVEAVGGHGPVDQAPLGGLGAVEGPAEQQQLAGPHRADEPGQQPGRAAVG